MPLFSELLPELLDKLIPILRNKINNYHNMFTLPLTSEYWEEVLHRSFKESGFETTWTPNRSHAVGKDMELIGISNSRISCKSGQFLEPRDIKKKCVKFNGGRSTKYKTLEEKIKHFSNDHDDYYFCLAKESNFNKTYKLLIFPSSLCKVDKLEWIETASAGTYKGSGPFSATISKAMSSQLWSTIPLDLLEYKFDINTNATDN